MKRNDPALQLLLYAYIGAPSPPPSLGRVWMEKRPRYPGSGGGQEVP